MIGSVVTNYNQDGAFAYLTAQANTTVTTGGTFYKIGGTFSNPVINGFSLGVSDTIDYDGSGGIFEIDWHATVSCDDASRTVHVGIAIDGETLTTSSPSVMAILCKTAGEKYSLGGTDVVTLATGDTVQLQLTSDTNLDVVTVYHFTTTIRRFIRS